MAMRAAKQNQILNMWLAAANRLAGSARVHTIAQMKKSADRANKKAVVDTVSVWLKVLATSRAGRKDQR